MRRKDREVTDIAEIRGIIEECLVMRLAMVDQGRPYLVPLSFGWEMDDANRLTLYFHAAAVGRKNDILAVNPEVCFEMDIAPEIIAAEQACEYGCTYASIIGEGQAQLLADTAEKEHALQRIMLQQTGRGDFSFPPAMLKATAVFRVVADSYSAKRCPGK